jgi:hypothetical protein
MYLKSEGRVQCETEMNPWYNAADTANENNSDRGTTPRTADALLKEAEYRLTRRGLELAEENVQLILFFLERMHPKERAIKINLPEVSCDYEALEAFRELLKAVASGQILGRDAKVIAAVLESYARALKDNNLESRIKALEATDRMLLSALKEVNQDATKPRTAANRGVR